MKAYLDEEFEAYMSEWDDTDTVKDISLEGYKEFLNTASVYPESNNMITSILSWYGDGTTDVILLEVPTTKPWELPAYVPFSGFNECPMPDVMMNICKYWYEQYGAEPAVFYGDGMEITVPTPLQPEDALNAAMEQLATRCEWVDTEVWLAPGLEDEYADMNTSDLVYAYAECLQDSTVWFFWWD